MISFECYTFKAYNSHMLISKSYYSLMFCVFLHFLGFFKKASVYGNFQDKKIFLIKVGALGSSAPD